MKLEICKGKTNVDASIDVNLKEGEKCFLTAYTTEYYCEGNCGVIIGDIEVMKKFGWCGREDIDKMNSMEIGEKYEGSEYWGSVFIIRLG